MAVACNLYKFVLVTVSLPKRLHNDRFTSENALRFAGVSEVNPLDPEVV
jgi:hypothetical protein